jgi:hypothetical protein
MEVKHTKSKEQSACFIEVFGAAFSFCIGLGFLSLGQFQSLAIAPC